MVTEDEGRTSQAQVWSAGLLLHRKSSIWFWKTFPNLVLEGVPVGKVWESLGYATRKHGSHTFTRNHIKKVKKQVNLILVTYWIVNSTCDQFENINELFDFFSLSL